MPSLDLNDTIAVHSALWEAAQTEIQNGHGDS